jgi:hypothetical protein
MTKVKECKRIGFSAGTRFVVPEAGIEPARGVPLRILRAKRQERVIAGHRRKCSQSSDPPLQSIVQIKIGEIS